MKERLYNTVNQFEDVLVEIENLTKTMQLLKEYFDNPKEVFRNRKNLYELEQAYEPMGAITRLITDKLESLHKDGYNYLDSLTSEV